MNKSLLQRAKYWDGKRRIYIIIELKLEIKLKINNEG